ncbi:MAG: hypothetical protein OXG91_01260, partial [bacterium]|nr:hypothetical protein [bacterium]
APLPSSASSPSPGWRAPAGRRLLAAALALGLAGGAAAQTTPFLTASPAQIEASSLNQVKITLTPRNASFLFAGGGGGGGVRDQKSVYLIESGHIVRGTVPHWPVSFSRAGLAKFTLSGAPPGVSIISARLLARQTGTSTSHGTPSHRSAEITLTHNGQPIASNYSATVTVSGDLLRVPGNRPNENDTEKAQVADLSASVLMKRHPAVILSTDTLAVTEGSESYYTVRLGRPPAAAVTVSITGNTNAAGLRVTPGTLTFPAGANWAAPQRVTVAADHDNDAVNPPPVALTHTVTGGFSGESAALSVNIHDDEGPVILLEHPKLDVTEAQPKIYRVKLSRAPAPAADVTVRVSAIGERARWISIDNDDAGTFGDPFPNPLTFTPANWDEWQRVRFHTWPDHDADDNTAILRHTASGVNYEGVTADLPVSISDLDVQGINPSLATLAVREGFGASFTVKLDTHPKANTVTLTVTGHANTDLTVDTDPHKPGNQDTLTFTTDPATIATTHWQVPRSVRVFAGHDGDTADDTATLRLTTAGGDYTGLTADITVNTADDDEAAMAGLVLSPAAVSVDEGGSAAWTVALETQPSAAVTVALAAAVVSGRPDLFASPPQFNLSPASLTFQPSQWNMAQTVTASIGEDDARATNWSASVAHTASGGGYDAVSATQAVTVRDNDAGVSGTLTIEPAAAAVVEGERAQFIVTADPAPTTDLAVAIKATWFGDVSGGSNAASGVIPAGRLASTILSLPTADNEVQAGNGSVTARIDAFGSHGYRAGSPAAATVTVRDDEGDSTVRRLRSHAGILGAGKSTIRGKKPDGAYTYSQTLWEVTEGQPRQDTYAYWQIVGPPHACVQLFVEVQGAFFYSPDQTFRSWGRSRVCLNEHGLQEPNVRIRNDLVDEPHGWAKMTVLAGDGYWVGPGDEGLHESWTIPIKDDDVSVASLDLSPPRIFENAELGANRSTVTASLSGPTANDVTLVVEADPVSPATADDFTLSQNRRLTIPAGQTASTGRVTVTAADDDSVEVYKEVTVWATASGGLDPVGQPEDVTLTIANDDKPRLRIAADAASVTEGTPAAFTVTSDVAVPEDLTVNFEVAQSGGFVAAGSLGRGTVTLTTGAQTVSFTVATVADGTDEANGTVTATLADGEYGTVGTNNAATVAVVDDDPGHVTLTTPVRDAYEGLDIYAQIHLALNRGLVSGEVLAVPLLFQPIRGSSATPNEDFTLYAGGSAGVRLDRDTSTVVFTGPDSGAGPSAVTVQVIAEVDDDADSERFYVDIPAGSTGAAPRLTATGLGGGVTGSRGDRRHAMYLRDRGVNQRTLGWAAKALEVTETAAAGSIGVELSSPASEALTFEVCLSDGTATFGTDYRGVVLGTESCTGTNSVTNADLTIGAGASRATVSFTSIADAIDEPDETYTAWLKHDRWEDLATSPRVLEVTLRDDDPTVVRLARAGRSAIREGDKVAFTVSLERALAKGEVIDAPLSISGAGVTPGDWSLAAKSGAANTGATLLGTAAPAVRFAGAGARTATLELTATAQDGAEVGGETFTVALGSNAQFDADADTNVGGGADPHGVDNAFNVKVNDNETGTVTRTLGWAATAQSVAEGAAGAEKQFSVNAALSAGTGPATFRVCLADGAATLGATGDYRGFPGDARCTGTGNANPDPAIASGQSSQAVSLTLRGDGEDEPDETFSATLSLPDAVAGLGLNAPKSTHTVTIVDDDPTVVSLDGPGSGVTVSEGGSTQFTINLGRTLVAGETIDVPLAVSGTNVTPDEWTLAKNPAGRNTGVSLLATDSATPAVRFAGGGARTAYLELTPAIDARAEAGGETFTVALGPDGAGANGFDRTGLGTNVGGGADPHGTDNAFDLTVTDAQTPQIGLSTVALTVAEGGDASYTVRLATEPTQTVTVEVALPADSDLTLDPVPATLTFTTTDWNEPQTVTVTAGEDDDVLNDTDTLSHIAAGGDYELLTAALQVTVTDDDTTEVLLSKETLALTEGGDAATYTVTLASAPTSDVIVDITGLADTDLTLEPSSAQLVFTSANWNEPQTVTVTPGEDDDTVNDEATLTHTASGGDYDALTATLKVNTTDDDSPNLVLSEGTLEVGEGSSAGYTVRLATEPSATVTVAITGQAG